MAHFAKIEDGRVVSVIVAEQSFVDTLSGQWIQTSYNTRGGVHTGGKTPLRKNFAGVGYTYDPQRDAFIPPKYFDSWALDEETCLWKAPIPKPEDEFDYVWDEETKNWVVTEEVL